MKQVGVFEGKTHFSALIDESQRGESTLITRNGTPVAQIVPIDAQKPREFGFDDGLGYIADDFNDPLPAELLESFGA